MALLDTTWYLSYGNGSSTGYYAVGAWVQNTITAVGALIRQATTPAVGNERVFVCIVAGTTRTTGAGGEPTWVVTRGAKTTDATVTWQEITGQPSMNGDSTNTQTWTQVHTNSTAGTLGQVCKDAAGTYYFIISTAGTLGSSEPSWNLTAGVTTTDNGATWTCLGAISSFSATWAAPHARLANAVAWQSVPNQHFIADNSAETQSTSLTLSYNAGAGVFKFNKFLSVDHTAAVPPTDVKAGASVACTGNTDFTIGTSNNTFYCYGITFKAGDGANSPIFKIGTSSSPELLIFDNCAFVIPATGSGGGFVFGGIGDKIIFNNGCTFQFGAVGQSITVSCSQVIWKNGGSIAGATYPTTMFIPSAAAASGLTLRGIDLSGPGAGKTIVGAGVAGGDFQALFMDCKTNASATLGVTPAGPAQRYDFIRCDSAGTNYLFGRYWYEGTLTQETTIVRTGGATDGVQAVAYKIVTTANAQWLDPFECPPIAIWNTVTGTNRVVTVYGIWGGGAVPNNDDIWFEIEYPGDSGSPLAKFASTTKSSTLATNSAVSSDTSTWGGSTTAFKLVATLSGTQPQLAGFFYITVKAAKLSSTFYIDPKPVLS
jgi:hypothetical protein